MFLPICVVLASLSGCMTMPTVDMSTLKSPGPATTVLATWEPAVSNGNNPERGFGGRVYFYDSERNRPVKIKGTVIVYAFDEDGRSPGDAKPNEGYVFDSKTLNSKGVYAKSKLGHSYNLWIPIDAAKPENPTRKISLIVRYIPDKGSSLVSQQTTSLLPGKSDYEKFVAQVEINEWDGPIQEALSHSDAAGSVPDRARMTEERMIESNFDRLRTMQAATIR